MNDTSLRATSFLRIATVSLFCAVASLHDSTAQSFPPIQVYGLGKINAAALAPDGSELLVAVGPVAASYNIDTGYRTGLYTPGIGEIFAVEYSPDGSFVAIGGMLAPVILYESRTGVEFRRVGSDASQIVFSRDGTLMAIVREGSSNSVSVVETQRDTTTVGILATGSSVDFSPDNERVLVAGSNGLVMYDLETRRPIQEFDSGGPWIQFAPDGRRFLGHVGVDRVNILNAATGQVEERLHLSESGNNFLRATYSNDGTRVLAGGNTGVALWNLGEGIAGDFIEIGQFNANVISLDFSPSDESIVYIGYETTLALGELGYVARYSFETSSREKVWGNPFRSGGTFSARFVDGGEMVLTSSIGNNMIGREDAEVALVGESILWNSGTGQKIRTIHFENSIEFCERGCDGSYVAILSPDERKLAFTSYFSNHLDQTEESRAGLVDAESGEELYSIGDGTRIRKLLFSRSGNRIYAPIGSSLVALDAESGSELMRFGTESTINDIAVSHSDNEVLLALSDGSVRVLDAETFEELSDFFGHYDSVWAVDISQDGSIVVTGSADETARVWDFESREELMVFEHEDEVTNVKFSPDGCKIVTSTILINGYYVENNPEIRIWDVHSGLSSTIYASRDEFSSLSFSSDGSTLLSSVRDSGAFLWPVPQFGSTEGEGSNEIEGAGEIDGESAPANEGTGSEGDSASMEDGESSDPNITPGCANPGNRVQESDTSSAAITLLGVFLIIALRTRRSRKTKDVLINVQQPSETAATTKNSFR